MLDLGILRATEMKMFDLEGLTVLESALFKATRALVMAPLGKAIG